MMRKTNNPTGIFTTMLLSICIVMMQTAFSQTDCDPPCGQQIDFSEPDASGNRSNPCSSILSLGAGGPANLQYFVQNGTGVWTTSFCSSQVCSGKEQIYSFTAPYSGIYKIHITYTNVQYVAYHWKSGACSSTGWNCIALTRDPGVYGNMNWTAGTTYYILLDARTDISTNHQFYLGVPEAPGTWYGTVSSSWHTSSNWSGGYVPNETVDVTIPAGTTYQPNVQNNASCKSLTVQANATLNIGAYELHAHGAVNIHGALNMTSTLSKLRTESDINWHPGSSASQTGNSTIFVRGNWEFKSGANIQLNTGFVDFFGSGNSYMRTLDAGSHFYHVKNNKAGTLLGHSGASTQACRINGNLYIYSNCKLISNTAQNIQLAGFVNNMSGMIELASGTFVFGGTGSTSYFMAGDYFNHVTVNSIGTTTFDNNIEIRGNLLIQSGVLSVGNKTITLKGNWTNNVFPTGFNAGTGRVIFNGSGHQYVYSNENFNILEANMGAALRINNAARTVTCAQYHWTSGGIDVIAGTFTANDLAQNGLYGGFWLGTSNATINLINSTGSTWVDLRGQIYNYGGTLNLSGTIADWPYANGAHLEMSGGVIDLKTCGLTIYNNYTWTHNITGGTIKTSRGYSGNRADFTPTAGIFEFYGSTDFNITQFNGSTLHHVRINKGARDGGEEHINGPVYDERSGELLSDGSRANTISLGSNFTVTGNLNIDAGTFSVGQHTCDITGNTNINGTLAMTHASGVINANGNVVWNSGSTANFTAMNVFNVWGYWNFESASNANLENGVVAFRGSDERFVRSYSATSSFYNISSYKTGGVDFGISSWSTQPLTIGGNIYVHAGAKFGVYSNHNVTLKGNVNSNGDFVCNSGTVVLNGVNQNLRMNTGNYFNHLTFNQSGTVTINNSLSNILDVKRNVVIQSGVFNMQDRIMHVGGNWTNNAGTAAFTEGTGRVVFNGTGNQTCNSETFNILEVNKTSGTLNFPGTTVCATYDWTAGGIIVNGGTFTANDLADNGLFGSYTVNNGTINLHQDAGEYVDFAGDITIGNGGVLNVYGGSMMSYWPFFSDASLTMSGNAILDIKDQGILVANNALSFTTSITGGTIRTSGGFQGNRADFTPNAGTFEFYGSGNRNISQSNGSRLHHVLINKSAKDGGEDTGTGPIYDLRSGELLSDGGRSNTISMTSDFTLTGNINIDAGTLNAATHKLNVGRDWTNNVWPTGFSAGTSTVEFFGPNKAKINTAETFNNMTVNKTYLAFDGLEIMSVPVTVLNNLDIIDGTLEVNSNSVLTIGNNVSIADEAGLNVGILDFDIEVYIGGNYTNNNTLYNTTQGYTPGGETITFNGTGDQYMYTVAAQEDFGNFRIDKPSGSVRPTGNLQILGDFEIASGSFSSNTSGRTHYFHGDFAIGATGNYYPGSLSTTAFYGEYDQSYFNAGGSALFYDFIVDKTASKSVNPLPTRGSEKGTTKILEGRSKAMTLTLLSDAVVFGGSTATVTNGTLDLGGNDFVVNGTLNINTGGVVVVPAASKLRIVNGLYVNSGGVLETVGTNASKAWVTRNTTPLYAFEVGSGGTIKASHTIFEYMNANGINIKPGAIVDAVHSFHNCTFRLGAPAPSTLLTIDNSQTFMANHTVFPANTWGGQYNVTKNVNQGHVTFYNATGSFAGENFDNDFSNRIDWFEPTLAASPLTRTVTPPAGTTTFAITSNMTWTVTESTGWFSVSPMGGSNNGTITVSYDRNTSASSRSGNITISAPDVADVILSVVQEGVTLALNPLVRDVSAGAGTTGFSLTSNAAWTISESIPWFSISPMNGTGNSMLAVSYDANTSFSSRSGQFTISSTGVPDIVATVNQSGVLIPVNQLVSGTVLPGDYECYDASQTITVQNYVVENNASVNLVAGQNIIMLPGTHAKNGSYFHAWISDVDHCGIIPTPTFLAVNDEILATAIKEEAPPVTSQFFRVYPNPTTGLFILELADADETAVISVEIYSMLGEILLHADLLASCHYQFDLSGRQAGMYLIKVRKGDRVGFEKIVKQ